LKNGAPNVFRKSDFERFFKMQEKGLLGVLFGGWGWLSGKKFFIKMHKRVDGFGVSC
jgi:hypothetical protein